MSLDLPLCDLDRAIETAAGTTIPDIFKTEGEPGFRKRETLALTAIASESARVIALGGGAILSPINRQTIALSGWCVWLDADAEEIISRLAGDETAGHHRPSLTELPAAEEIRSLMKTRQPLYRETANLRIDTSARTAESIVEEIAAAYAEQLSD